MKRSFLVLFLLTIFYAAQAQDKITLFSGDFSGTRHEFAIGQYDFRYLAVSGVTTVRSVAVPQGLMVVLFSEDNYGGKQIEITSDAHTNWLQARGFGEAGMMLSMKVMKAPAPEPPADTPAVTIYRDNYAGSSQRLKAGTYEPSDLSIGNDQLSSIKIPSGMRVTLYEHGGKQGRTLTLTRDTPADVIVKNKFNDVTSSIVVELLPVEPVKPAPQPTPQPQPQPTPQPAPQPDPQPTGPSVIMMLEKEPARLALGSYRMEQDLHFSRTLPFSFKIPFGMQVILEDETSHVGPGGYRLILSEDTPYEKIAATPMKRTTAWITVRETPPPTPKVVWFEHNFSGTQYSVEPGKYDVQQLGMADNTISSVQVPYGLQITLYENPGYQGRMMVLRNDADADFFIKNQFNDIASSISVDKVSEEEQSIILYAENYSGPSQVLVPGRYSAKDLAIGGDQVSSVKVPNGMKVILYEGDQFTGRSLTLTRNADGNFLLSNRFNNITSSVVVEDAFVPFVSPVPVAKPEPVRVDPAPTAPVVELPVTPVVTVKECVMSEQQYELAVATVRGQSFSSDKLESAKLAIKGRCLSLKQVRGLASELQWDDAKFEFLQLAYNDCTEQSDYYTLSDMFSFSSTVQRFRDMLKNK